MAPHTKLHASEHVDGTDDIQSATNSQKGLATATHITDIESNNSHRVATTNPHATDLGNLGTGTLSELNALVTDLTPTYGGIRDIGVGTLAQRPAFGTADRFFYTTDEQNLYRDTGAAWESLQVAPDLHAASHTDGTDDIQSATNSQKGLATAAQITDLEANTTHRTSDGTDHTFINQDLRTTSKPTFAGLTSSANIDGGALQGDSLTIKGTQYSGPAALDAYITLDEDSIAAISTGVVPGHTARMDLTTTGASLSYSGSSLFVNDVSFTDASSVLSALDPGTSTSSRIDLEPGIGTWEHESNVAGDDVVLTVDQNLFKVGIGDIGGTVNDILSVTKTLTTNEKNMLVKGALYSDLPTTMLPTGTTQTIDHNNGNCQKIDLNSATGDVTISFSNEPAGRSSLALVVVQGSTARNLVFPAACKTAGGTPGAKTLTITATNDAEDLVVLYHDNGTYYLEHTTNWA